jgi:hypothetical protein
LKKSNRFAGVSHLLEFDTSKADGQFRKPAACDVLMSRLPEVKACGVWQLLHAGKFGNFCMREFCLQFLCGIKLTLPAAGVRLHPVRPRAKGKLGMVRGTNAAIEIVFCSFQTIIIITTTTTTTTSLLHRHCHPPLPLLRFQRNYDSCRK